MRENVISVEPSPRVNWQLPVATACILLGILVAVQFRVQRNQAANPSDRTKLLEILEKTEDERGKLSQELQQARGRINELEKSISEGRNVQRTVDEEIQRARLEAGLLALKGPGVEVRMLDSTRKPAPDEDPYFYIVHDVDIQALVNELWASGAEAVCINDQRVVARTSIRCVGPTILVNAVRLAPPYLVRAIGPPKDMETALRMPGGFLSSMDMLRNMGGDVRITTLNEVVIPAFNGSLVYRHAVPAPPEPSEGSEPR
ncbi:MAG: DUF881 domain-containing protein [Candidatus Eremiobacterota bacterium]